MAEFVNKPMNRRTFVGGSLAMGAAALSALSVLPGCGGGGGGNKTLRYYINNPVCIEPFNLQEDQGTMVGFQLFDSLCGYNYETGELEGLACESWEANDDATKFTFHLRPAKFHDGTDVTSASFKYGWERMVNPNTNPESPSVINYHISMVKGYDELAAGKAKEMSGLSCPDDSTFVVELQYSYADFPYVCSHPALAPIPECAKEMDFMEYFRAPIGNGPLKMEGTWEDGQGIKLVKFDDYYGEPSKIDGVDFIIQKDVETAYREFEAGNLDVADVPTAQYAEAKEKYGAAEGDGNTITPGHQVLTGEQLSIYYMVCNCTKPPFDNVDVRRAVSLAINREAICDTVFKGTRKPAGSIVPAGIKGAVEGDWQYSHYDPKAAAEYFDKAGYPNTGTEKKPKRDLRLVVSSNLDGGHKEVMDVIMSSLAEVGVTCEADTPEWAALLDKYQKLDYEFGRLGWVADYPIMDNFLYPLFYTGVGDNRCGYSNPEVDKLLMDARSTVDDDERIKELQKASAMIGDDSPVIPVMTYTQTSVGSDRIKKLYMDPQKKSDLSQVELA